MTLRTIVFGLVFLMFIASPIHASRVLHSPPPDPNALLLAVRRQQATQNKTLHAKLRDKSSSTPFLIVWRGGTIRYEFSDPEQILFLRLGDKSSEIQLQEGEKASQITQFDQRVRGTSVTYEDLAFRFLYWPNPTVVGEDKLNGRGAWILQVTSPGKSSRYGTVRIWIDKESGALLRMVAFDQQKRAIKRFEVVSAQRTKNLWFLKEMRIEELDPASGNVVDRAYLTIMPK